MCSWVCNFGQICSSGDLWKCTGLECELACGIPSRLDAKIRDWSEIKILKCACDTAELHPAAGCVTVGCQIECLHSSNDPGLLQAFNFRMTRVFHSHAAWTKLDYCSAPAKKSRQNSVWKHSNTQMGRIQDPRFSWPLYFCPSFSFSFLHTSVFIP